MPLRPHLPSSPVAAAEQEAVSLDDTLKRASKKLPAESVEQRLIRFSGLPKSGPKVLFFTGGSALNPLSEALTRFTHNSCHLVTPFDSGGSSAQLRKAFDMPAVGDLRSRMLALANRDTPAAQSLYRLAHERLSTEQSPEALLDIVEALATGQHPLIQAVPNPLKILMQSYIAMFLRAMPKDFDLRDASIGNLILAGGFLDNKGELEPIIELLAKVLGLRGSVNTVCDAPYHLGVQLEDGRTLLGQHRFTGKQAGPIDSAISSMWITKHCSENQPAMVMASQTALAEIKTAELICFPPGSFYSSIMANLLPRGVGRTIADNPCPKVFVPNLGKDPEQHDMSLHDCILRLLRCLQADIQGERPETSRLLNYVLIDSDHSRYRGSISKNLFAALGVTLIERPLVTEDSAPYYDPDKLSEALLSLM